MPRLPGVAGSCSQELVPTISAQEATARAVLATV